MVSSGDHAQQEIAPSKLEQEHGSNNGNRASKEIPSNEVNKSQSDQKGKSLAMVVIPEKAVQEPNALQSGQKGNTPSKIREKVSEDGYNWRKYGQKLVKGNEFVRSYYKCTHPNCQVKKQLECSHEGKITDTIYFGHHDHPKQQLVNIPEAVGFVVSIVDEKSDEPSSTNAEEKSSIANDQTPQKTEQVDAHPPPATDDVKAEPLQLARIRDDIDHCDASDSKRHKKGYRNSETQADKPNVEPHVVRTLSEVDFVNDGYRWRKYGQKLVKGNLNPRSYYRCSTPGCPAKKHVERSSNDPKLVVTMYDGQHDHDMPPARTVMHNTTGPTSTTSHSSEAQTKSEDQKDQTIVPTSVPISNLGPEGKVNEPNGMSTNIRVASDNSGAVNGKSNEVKTEIRAKSGESDSNCGAIVVHDNVQQIKSGEQPVQS